MDHPLAETGEQACVEASVHRQEVWDFLVAGQVCSDHKKYLVLMCLLAADYPAMYVDVDQAAVRRQRPGSCH